MAGKTFDNLWIIHFIAGVTTAARSSSRSGFMVISSANTASRIRASMTTLMVWMAASRIKIFFVVCTVATSGATWSTAARICWLYGTPMTKDFALVVSCTDARMSLQAMAKIGELVDSCGFETGEAKRRIMRVSIPR
jgi:hypothetical protein